MYNNKHRYVKDAVEKNVYDRLVAQMLCLENTIQVCFGGQLCFMSEVNGGRACRGLTPSRNYGRIFVPVLWTRVIANINGRYINSDINDRYIDSDIKNRDITNIATNSNIINTTTTPNNTK